MDRFYFMQVAEFVFLLFTIIIIIICVGLISNQMQGNPVRNRVESCCTKDCSWMCMEIVIGERIV